MSVKFTEVDSDIALKAAYRGTSKFIYAFQDPSSTQHLPLPADYKFTPYFMPKKFESIANRVQNLKIHADDVWVVSYPKSGTTWMLNIVWQLRNNLDFTASPVNAYEPFLEVGSLFNEPDNDIFQANVSHLDTKIDQIDEESSPRTIKTHLPLPLLPKELWTVRPKIIYVARNPKDVVISLFHMHKDAYFGSLSEFFELFLNDHVYYSPIHNHVLDFWQLRDLDHILFITYEEMTFDPFGAVKRVSEFLGREYSDDQLIKLAEHVSFEKLKKLMHEPPETLFGEKNDNSSFKMLRRGKVAGFRDEMSAEFIKKFDGWTAKRLKNSDFKYAV